MWDQWGGIIQRGRPTSLVLRRLTPKVTVLRAPGPGAIRRVEWKASANEFLFDRKVVLHTDSAKSYKLKVPGALEKESESAGQVAMATAPLHPSR